MYAIFNYIWLSFVVHVGCFFNGKLVDKLTYTIHGSYGHQFSLQFLATLWQHPKRSGGNGALEKEIWRDMISSLKKVPNHT